MKVNITITRRNGEVEHQVGVPVSHAVRLKQAPEGDIVDFEMTAYREPVAKNSDKLNAIIGKRV